MSFYSMVGTNGVGVMESEYEVLRTRKYSSKATVKAFDTFQEAESWALSQFSERFPHLNAPISLRLNWFIYARHCSPKE